jgi:hypothetical protein
MGVIRSAYSFLFLSLLLTVQGPVNAQYVDLLWDRIAHYPIIEGADDISGYNNHGLVSGANLADDRWGNADHAYYFDGIDDRIFCGYNLEPLTSSLTVACWIRIDDSNRYSHIISKYDFTSDGGFILGIEDGLVRWSGRIGSGQFISMTSATRIDNDQWHHIMGVIDGPTWSVYVDGILDMQIETGYLHTNLQCSEPLTVGMYHRGDGGDHRYFKGTIDGILIYKRVLNACEIEGLYSGVSHSTR